MWELNVEQSSQRGVEPQISLLAGSYWLVQTGSVVLLTATVFYATLGPRRAFRLSPAFSDRVRGFSPNISPTANCLPAIVPALHRRRVSYNLGIQFDNLERWIWT